MASCLHGRKGVMQGGTITMIAYEIGILPLIKNLKWEIPDVTQPWYADNAGSLGKFARLDTYFDSLTRQGLGRGYYPEPSKIVLIVRPENLEAGKVFRARHVFKVCTGARYLGGYIGDGDSKQYWLRESTLTWDMNIHTIRKTMGKYPQESYATVVHAIQPEWIFLQCITWDMAEAFVGVEKMIRETFLPHIFFRKTKTLSPVVGYLSAMPVNKAVLGILNTVTSA